MSTQIIDGFQINSNVPVDSRIVASGSVARNAIVYKYEGLRVFDTSDGVPYVWLNNSWISENSSVIVGSENTANYIPIFNASNIVSNSKIYQVGSNIGVNTLSPSATFSVNGSLSATTLSGDGSNITSIDGSNISSATIPVDGTLPSGSKIIKGTSGQVLVSGNSFTFWQNQNQLFVGTSSVALISNTASSVSVTNNTSNATNYLTFVSSAGSPSVRINTSGLSYNPSTKVFRTNGGDINLSSSVSSNGYVIMGARIYEYSELGATSINPTITTINVPSSSIISVEVTFTGKILESGGLSNNRSTKYVAVYKTSPTGVITQIGATVTTINVSSNTGSSVLNAGAINFATSGQIKFTQSVSGTVSLVDVYLTVDYKITVS